MDAFLTKLHYHATPMLRQRFSKSVDPGSHLVRVTRPYFNHRILPQVARSPDPVAPQELREIQDSTAAQDPLDPEDPQV